MSFKRVWKKINRREVMLQKINSEWYYPVLREIKQQRTDRTRITFWMRSFSSLTETCIVRSSAYLMYCYVRSSIISSEIIKTYASLSRIYCIFLFFFHCMHMQWLCYIARYSMGNWNPLWSIRLPRNVCYIDSNSAKTSSN